MQLVTDSLCELWVFFLKWLKWIHQNAIFSAGIRIYVYGAFNKDMM